MTTPNWTQQCNSFKCLTMGCQCSASIPFGSVNQIHKKALRPRMYIRLPEAVNDEEADLQDYEAPLLDAMDLSIPEMEGDNYWPFSNRGTRPRTMTRVRPAETSFTDRPSISIVADNARRLPSECDDFTVDIQALQQTAANVPQCERDQDVVLNNTNVTVNVAIVQDQVANEVESAQSDEESSDHSTGEFTDDFMDYVNNFVDSLENATNDSMVFNQQQHEHEKVNQPEVLVDIQNQGLSNNNNNAAVTDAVANTSSQPEALQDKSSHGSSEEREDDQNDTPMHNLAAPEERQRVTVQDGFVIVMGMRGYVNEHGVFRVPKSEAEDIAVASFKRQVKLSGAGRKKRKAGPDRRSAYTKLHDALGHAGWKREVKGDYYYYSKL